MRIVGNQGKQTTSVNEEGLERLELTRILELSRNEGDSDNGGSRYVFASVEELLVLVDEVVRLRKEVAYLKEALHLEERQTVRFRREHDCY